MENHGMAGVRPEGSDGKDTCEVSPRPRRRTFPAEYKLRILKEADSCRELGEVGALLRREGLYSSHLSEWRHDRERGALWALGKRRGRKAKQVNPLAEEVSTLRKEVERLRRKLAQAELIIDVQKKVAALLGIPLKSPDSDGND